MILILKNLVCTDLLQREGAKDRMLQEVKKQITDKINELSFEDLIMTFDHEGVTSCVARITIDEKK